MMMNKKESRKKKKKEKEEQIMKVRVDPDLCTGCELCVDTCPAVFEVTDGVAKPKVNPVPANEEENCRTAASDCPSEAISIEE
jgi:ferredoxin